MWWKIVLEVLIAITLLTIGSAFWSILKSRGHLQTLLSDENELKRLLNHWTVSEIVREGGEIKPIFGSYVENIRFFERAHFAALKKTRNLTFTVAVVLIALSYLMGLPYFIASLAVFILPSFSRIGTATKNNKSFMAMVKLVEKIQSSPYHVGLFAWTSMHDLCIVQTPVKYPYNGPYLRIAPIKLLGLGRA